MTDPAQFRGALREVLAGLAFDIVRNGEGTGHALRVRVERALDEATALGVARAIANSPLVKTAIFGNDPNVGRIVSAIGDYMGNEGAALRAERTVVRMGGEEIFSGGCFRLDADKETTALRVSEEQGAGHEAGSVAAARPDRGHRDQLDGSSPAVEVLGSDLSYDYVRENADYRS